MAEITDITIERGKAVITFDGRGTLTVRKNDVAVLGLCAGQEWDTDALRGKVAKNQFPEGYEAALTILDRSARTKSEIARKLAFKGYLEETCEAIVRKLEESRLIDDTYIAERLVQSASAGGKGRFAIKQKLRARGLSAEDTEYAMSAVTDEDQSESAYREAVRLSGKYEDCEPRVFKMKLSQALARRGFAWDSIESALNRLNRGED